MEEEQKMRLPFVVLTFALFSIFIFGLIWLFAYSPASPIGAGWFLFSFAAGLSMIVLPCTLPLAFVIVPLAMGKGYRKGLGVALAFGFGITLTLSLYGLLVAIVGQFAIESLNLTLETVKNWLYAVAGIFTIIFALTEIGLTQWHLPSYSGAAPGFIQNRGDYFKALLLGLFLGNIGIGCPSPATYVLLSRIATASDIFYGWLLFFVHAIGRVTPLIFLALLAIIGINAARYLIQHKEVVEKATGWVLIFVGSFILSLGLFGHDWYVYSGIHVGLETITAESFFHKIMAGRLGVEAPHTHGIPTGPWLPYGSWVMVGVWTLVLLWHLRKQRKKVATLNEPEKSVEEKILAWKKWFIITLIVLLALVFGWALPHQFIFHSGRSIETEAEEDFKVLLKTEPGTLTFQITDSLGRPLQDLQISHERLLHIIIVSEDFSIFSHIHPEDFAIIPQESLAKATFSVPYVFPKAGQYHFLLDFTHQDHEVNKMLSLEIAGPVQPVVIIKDLAKEKTFDGYKVSLTQEGERLKYRIEKDGQAVTNLEPYLREAMHLAVFSLDFSYFLHTHGELPEPKGAWYFIKPALANGKHAPKAPAEKHEKEKEKLPSTFGPEIEAHIAFPWPGLYKIFGEFKHQGKVIVTDFMVHNKHD